MDAMEGEVLKQLGRLEASVEDARADIQKVSADSEYLKSQVAGTCNMVRDLKNDMKLFIETQNCLKIPDRVEYIETQLQTYSGAVKVVIWIVGILFTPALFIWLFDIARNWILKGTP